MPNKRQNKARQYRYNMKYKARKRHRDEKDEV